MYRDGRRLFMLVGLTRVRNEELIIKDTLDYYSKICDGGIYVYDDCSTDKTREVISAHPAVKGSIFSPAWDEDRARAEWQNRKAIYQLAQKGQPDDTWFIYFDADERVELDTSLLDEEANEAIYLRLFDFYITPSDAHREYTGDLIPLRDWIGPEYRDILMLFRKSTDPKWHQPDQREPDLQKPNVRITGPGGFVRHYGKSISVEQWEETCRYYADHFPMYSEKWEARKGKAVHDGVSDFGNALIRWEDMDNPSATLIPLKRFKNVLPPAKNIKGNHQERRHHILLATNHLFGFTGSEITLFTIAQCLKEKKHLVSIYAKYIDPSFTPLFKDVGPVYTNLDALGQEQFDAAYVQHHTIALEVRHHFPQLPIVFASLGVVPFLEQPPLVDLNIHKYLAISEEVKANLIRKGIHEARIAIFRNIVDSRRFRPVRTLNKHPQLAAIYSYKIEREKVRTVTKACAALGIKCSHIGKTPGAIHQEDLATRLNDADIVFTLGRGAIETMMCGKIPIVFDYQGGDGMVTTGNIDELMKCNFSGRRYAKQFTVEEMIHEIKLYNADDAPMLQRRAIDLFDADKGVETLLSHIEESMSTRPGALAPSARESLQALVQVIDITNVYTLDAVRVGKERSRAVEKPLMSPSQLHTYALLLLQGGDSAQAMTMMEKAYSLDPSNSEVVNDLGALYYQVGEEDKASMFFRRAIDIDDSHLDARKNLADLHASAGRVREAEALYKEVLARDPQDRDAVNALTDLLKTSKDQPKEEASALGTMLCTVCGNAAYHSVTKQNHLYYSCTYCGSVFTPSIDPEILVTENQGNMGWHNDDQNEVRLKNGSMPLASIIIPVFNQLAFTSRCLDALYQNTSLDRISEVIVIDNASTDGTREFLSEARRQYPKLKVLTNGENLLFAKACNQGADNAQGDYLVFLNNDTEPLPRWLDRALERLESDHSIGIVGVKLLYPDRSVQHCGIQFYRNASPHYAVWPLHRYLQASEDEPRVNLPEDVPAVTGACLFISREFFKRIGGFDERYGMYFEDTDLCFKARRAGKKVFYEPGSVVIHHEGKSSRSRDDIDELNARAARLFYQLWKEELYPFELETLIDNKVGKYVYLKEDFWPQANPEEIVRMYSLLKSFPTCYVHFGGSGDALLLLSTFYDRNPEQTIVSISNSTSMMRSFFGAFPKLKRVYFVPFPKNYDWHVIARRLFKSCDTCLGLGAAPTTDADYREWDAGIDISRTYGIQQRPLWATNFEKNRLGLRQVTIQPKGSLKGMVGSKRNVLDTSDWPLLLSFLEKKGVCPIIIGTPDEAAEYPCLGNAIDRRSYSFTEQMQLIAASDFFIGADSWGKTFSALAGIPTFVFHALRGENMKDWKDPSDYVFLEPWEEITVLKDLKGFRKAFDAAWKKKYPSGSDLNIRWEGSQFVHHSLALVNRELCLRLIKRGCNLSIVPYEKDQFTPKEDPRLKPLEERTGRSLPGTAHVHVRHQWPPNFTPPPEGHWVIIQPWEFGSIPREWVQHMSTVVDEVWVPSHYVREGYIQSGVPAERVFVVPNGVDIDQFNPAHSPYPLKTKKTFKFLFVGGTIPRKGIDVLLDVYTRTFSSTDDVCLVIKDMGGQSFYKGQTAREVIDNLKAAPGSPEIEYIEHTLNSDEIAGLYTACDCLVHPYRGEGFGLPIAEAMASGCPVMVTGHGAALDFCHEGIAYLIPAQEVRLPERKIGDMETVDFPWLAEPDRKGLARLMKHVVAHKEEAVEKGCLAAAFIRANFTWDHAAEAVVARVRDLKEKPIIRNSPQADPVQQAMNSENDLVSIVLASCNDLDHTKKCVESIQRHTPERHEIVFVDNGSNDGTTEWLRGLVKGNASYKLIENKEKTYFAESCNKGIAASVGAYVLLLGNEVVVTAGWLSGMLNNMKMYPDTSMVGPMTNSASGAQKVDKVGYGDDLDRIHSFAAAFRRANTGKAEYEWHLDRFCLLINRELLDIIGGFDENCGNEGCETEDLCLRSILAGYRHLIACDVFVHRCSEGNMTESAVNSEHPLQPGPTYFTRKWSRFSTPSATAAPVASWPVIQNIRARDCIEELLRWGEECFNQGDLERAARIFERVICLDPKNSQALNNIGVIHWQSGDRTSAMKIFQDALIANHQDPDAWGNLLEVAKEMGKFDEVNATLLEIMKKHLPTDPALAKVTHDAHR